MAENEHVKILKTDAKEWNRWRKNNPDVTPDLARGNFGGYFLGTFDLKKANLYLANLSHSYIGYADLDGANLTEANLSNSKLEATTLDGALLHGADLQGVSGLHQSQIESALGDHRTLIPSHLNRPEHWTKPSQPTELLSPIDLAWLDGKIRLIEKVKSKRTPQNGVTDTLLSLQSLQIELAKLLITDLENANVDPRLIRRLARYYSELEKGQDSLNILQLDAFYKTISGYFDSNREALSDIDLSDIRHFFEGHKVFRTYFPDWHEYRDKARSAYLVGLSDGIDEDLSQAITAPEAKAVFDDPVPEAIQDELEQPKVNRAGKPNLERSYGVSAIALLIWRLLSSAPAALKNYEAVEKLVIKFSPIVEKLRSYL